MNHDKMDIFFVLFSNEYVSSSFFLKMFPLFVVLWSLCFCHRCMIIFIVSIITLLFMCEWVWKIRRLLFFCCVGIHFLQFLPHEKVYVSPFRYPFVITILWELQYIFYTKNSDTLRETILIWYKHYICCTSVYVNSCFDTVIWWISRV